MAAEFDVIVLGGGLSGLAAALAAQARGLRPLVLEKAPLLGGGTVDSYAIFWVGANHLAAGLGIRDDLESTREYVRFMAGGEASEARLDAFVEQAPAALRFFEKCGIPFQLIRGVPDHYFGLAPGALREGRALETALVEGTTSPGGGDRVRLSAAHPYWMTFEEQMRWGGQNNLSGADRDLLEARRAKDMRGKGVGTITHFARRLREANVPVMTGVSTGELLMKGGRVTGIVTGKGRKLAAGRGVVLATGGYESSPRLVEQFERLPGWVPATPPELTGDGLLLGERAGGATLTIRNSLLLFLGIPVPSANPDKPDFHPAYLAELCTAHTMVVNRNGQRFGDETSFQMLVPGLRRFDPATHAYANLPAYLIFDQQYADNNALAGGARGAPIPDWVARSRTIGGLARKLGIDAKGLADTVGRFNAGAHEGTDRDFHRGELAFRFTMNKGGGNSRLGAVEKPPFYGLRLCVSGYGSAGLLTDPQARVIDRKGEPIAGLYAIGNTAVHDEFGVGYQAGFSHTSSLTFGYLAVENMRKRGR